MKKSYDFVKEIFKGKSIGRVLFNWQVAENCRDLSGEVLDLASGGQSSYHAYLPRDLKVIKTDLRDLPDLNLKVDLNERLPFVDASQKNIFLFNAIYIVKNIGSLLKELNRILAPGGRLFISSIFVANEMAEPDDFLRLTRQGLARELEQAGFSDFKIIRFGERFSAAAQLLHPFFIFDFVRLGIYSTSLLLDSLIPDKVKKRYPCPIGYFCVIKK